MLQRHNIEISVVSRRRCPWENGYAERLICTLKAEEIHLGTEKAALGTEKAASEGYDCRK